MSNTYLRKWELYVDGEKYFEDKELHNFRIVFDVFVHIGNAQAFADIRLYNILNPGHIKRGTNIDLRAGYVDSCDTIFNGTVTNLFQEREGADISTRLMCRSGVDVRNRGTIVSSWGSEATIVDILTDVARAWPRDLEISIDDFKDAPRFTSGMVACDDIPTFLDKLKDQVGFQWIEDRGTLFITKPNAERTTNLFEVNATTGMVGIPEIGRGPDGLGLYVSTRINPFISVSSRIDVKARFSTYNTGAMNVVEQKEDLSADGEWNVLSMHYEGDSFGAPWNLNLDCLRPGIMATSENNQTPKARNQDEEKDLSGKGELVWGAKVDQAFRAKVREIAKEQGLNPNWYMAIMAFETGQSFLPYKKNPRSSATGLIQFIEIVAKELGTTTAELATMTAVQQLEYVKRYFAKYRNSIRTLDDMYMAVLWPIAAGKPNDYVLWTKTGKYASTYAANAELDKNGDGTITKEEAASRIHTSMRVGQANMN